jgi:hypothetical protein
MKVKFIKSAPSIKEAIDPNMVEIALLGRSNVGKSSFLNVGGITVLFQYLIPRFTVWYMLRGLMKDILYHYMLI